jgi:MerR family transcriptional regulator/heat shock protein HspR
MPGFDLDLYCQEHDQITIDTLASRLNMHPEFIRTMVELGIVTPVRRDGDLLIFHASALVRLRSATRLRRTLGVNLSSVAIILDLLDRICLLERENQMLRSRQK